MAEGEYIEQIEEAGDGWWSGIGPGGKSGLFPCASCFLAKTLDITLMMMGSQLC